MLAFGRGFCSLRRAQGLRAPLNPRQGCPPAPHAYTPSGDPAGAFSPRGRGAGEERPRHPAGGRLGSLRSRQGAVSSPLRGCGPHQPLDPPFTEKRAPEARAGLEGHCRRDGGKARAATAQRLGLDAQERPQRPGLVAGVLFPQPPSPRGERPRRPPEALLPLIFASEVWGFGAARSPENQVTKELTKRSAGRALCVSWL